MHSFTYVFMLLPFFTLWLVLFIQSPAIRNPLLMMSALSGLAGPISEFWHYQDYWHPDYLLPIKLGNWRFGIEDYLLSFFLAGIATALFETVAIKKGWKPLPPVSWKYLIRLDMFGNAGILLIIFFSSIMRLNSIYAILLALLLLSVVLYCKKPDWLFYALPLAFAFSVFYWILFRFAFMPAFPGIFEKWWNLKALWGIRLFGVPVEEPLWAFGVALFGGPVYRYCCGDLKKNDN